MFGKGRNSRDEEFDDLSYDGADYSMDPTYDYEADADYDGSGDEPQDGYDMGQDGETYEEDYYYEDDGYYEDDYGEYEEAPPKTVKHTTFYMLGVLLISALLAVLAWFAADDVLALHQAG